MRPLALGVTLAGLICSPALGKEFWFPASAGGTSCATWLSHKDQEIAGGQWVLGLWTGLNVNNPRNGMVGRSTDGAGIVAEVKLACQQAPSETLIATTLKTYHRLETEGR